MSESPDREGAFFEKALALLKAGDLGKARDLFELIVLENGEYRRRAEYFLAKIAEMTTRNQGGRSTRGASRRGEVFRGVPMAPPAVTPPPPPGAPAAPVTTSAPNAPQPLTRTPHMDLSPEPPVAPGTPIQVLVYTDTQAFRDGETGESIVIDAPPEQKSFEVDVWLTVGEPFVVKGEKIKTLTISRDVERSETLEFTVMCESSVTAPGEPVSCSALFSYRGRPCGQVTRFVSLAAGTPAESAPGPEIRIDATADRPDLFIQIVKTSPNGLSFKCLVRTPLLSDYIKGVEEVWELSSLAPDLVKEKMARFTAKKTNNFVRTLALRSAGMQLFEASPPLFQKVFWELIDRKLPLRTIFIVTEETSIPWELMVPTRPGDEETREPLGITYLLSRWTTRKNVSPLQQVPLRDAFVVAPRDSRLTNAEEEVSLVSREFTAERIDPADIQYLDISLAQQGRTLLHFICHGKSGAAGSQILLLEGQEELDASYLLAMPGVVKAFRDAKPLVFLNACEVGRQEPALVGAGGFAEAFMRLGASGVIAPLWSVKDSVAHEIAEKFYERVKAEPNTPFSQILADLRKQSYVEGGGEDTYAAYCFYGDPLARRAS